MPVIECDVSQARERLEAEGVDVTTGNTDHERWRAEHGGATAVAYDGKVVLQGANPARLEALLTEGGGRGHLYVDGASRGNPGPAAIGWVLLSGDGILTEGGKRVGKMTNNQAEYKALVHGLEIATEYGFEQLHIRSDSELVVKQVTGAWNTNDPDLQEYRVRVHELLRTIDEWSLTHVPRELNERADKNANEALDRG